MNNIDPTGHSWIGKKWKKARKTASKVRVKARACYNTARKAVTKKAKPVVQKVEKAYRSVKKAAKKNVKTASKWVGGKYKAAKKMVKTAAKKAWKATQEGTMRAVGSVKAFAKTTGGKLKNAFAGSATLNPSKGEVRTNALKSASSRAGWLAGGTEVAAGIGMNIYNGASAKKTVDDAVIDATFVTLGIGISTAVMMFSPVGWGLAAAITAGIVSGIAFSIAANEFDMKQKYRKAIGI